MNRLVCRSLLLSVAALVACSPVPQGPAYAEAEARVQGSARQWREDVGKATAAQVRVMLPNSDREHVCSLSRGEWRALQVALSHTEAVAPALETSEAREDDEAENAPYYMELVLVGADGRDISGVVVNTLPWMPQSQARQLTREMSRSREVPEWSLPDADYEALSTLPPLVRAQAWAREASAGGHRHTAANSAMVAALD